MLTNVSIETNSVKTDQTSLTILSGSALFDLEACKKFQKMTTKAIEFCCYWHFKG